MAIQNNPLYGYDKQWGGNNLNQPNWTQCMALLDKLMYFRLGLCGQWGFPYHGQYCEVVIGTHVFSSLFA